MPNIEQTIRPNNSQCDTNEIAGGVVYLAWGGPRGQPLTYDLGAITERVHDLLGLSLLVRSTTSWRPEINGKRSFDMIALLGPPSERALARGSF